MGNSFQFWETDDKVHPESEIHSKTQTESLSESMQGRSGSSLLLKPHSDQGALSPKKKPQKKGYTKNSRHRYRNSIWAIQCGDPEFDA